MSVKEVDQMLDASGLNCPLPLLKAKLALSKLENNQVLQVIATDSGSCRDIPAYLDQVEHELLDQTEVNNQYHFWIRVQHNG